MSTATPPIFEIQGRGRTHSDPDLPHLVPLGVRPHSSYEEKVLEEENLQFSPEILNAMAIALNISVEEQKEFNWIIRDCLLQLKEEGWLVVINKDSVEDLSFINVNTEECRSTHNIVDVHKALAERLILVEKELKQKRTDRHYLIREIVFKNIIGVKDVRHVASPKVIEQLLNLLSIDPLTEPYLIKKVKVLLEDSFFNMKAVGGHFLTTENVIDVNKMIVQLELDRILFLKKISPSGLLYCIECETALADVSCASCHDVLCNACMLATHSTGHRLDHPAVFIEQCVCCECETQSALLRCQECADLYCYECFKLTHKLGKRARHCVRLPLTTFCFECDEKEAAYICMDCEDVLCTDCNLNIHRKGARQNHLICGLRKAAYTKKLFANNIDQLLTIVNKNLSIKLPLTPWVLFYDEALNPFWYNFQTREQVRASTNDLIHPPEEPEVEDVTTSAAAIEASAGGPNFL